MNKYYVMLETRKIYGAYKFKDAIKAQKEFREYGLVSIILKEVIDIEGKEVK